MTQLSPRALSKLSNEALKLDRHARTEAPRRLRPPPTRQATPLLLPDGLTEAPLVRVDSDLPRSAVRDERPASVSLELGSSE